MAPFGVTSANTKNEPEDYTTYPVHFIDMHAHCVLVNDPMILDSMMPLWNDKDIPPQ